MPEAANDGLSYPTDFNQFMGVIDRWHRARAMAPREGEDFGGALLRTSHELDDAVAIFKQIWAKAEMKPEPYDPPLPQADLGRSRFGKRAAEEAQRLQRWMELCEKGRGQEVAVEIRSHLERCQAAQPTGD